VIPAIDLKYVASDQPRGIMRKKCRRNAHVINADEGTCRRQTRIMQELR
jgi:hypothetical protein